MIRSSEGERRMWRRVLGITALALIAVGGVATAGTATQFYVAVDQTRILDVGGPVAKVSIATPGIADVSMLSPTSLLVNGKATGVTSLIVVGQARDVRHYDVVVYRRSPPNPDAGIHSVLVQRGDNISNHLFIQNREALWQELGTIKGPAEAAKK
jgi:Flp pilus assembly secretin CpaC